MNAVELKNLNFKYKNAKKKTFENVNLIVNQGEILAICGVSGSGKSTLCNCICGLIPNVYEGEYSGEVKIFGQETKKLTLGQIGEKIGYVFQYPERQLFSTSVIDELVFPLMLKGYDKEEVDKRAEKMLKLFELNQVKNSYPFFLSYGEKRRLAIASVLTYNPIMTEWKFKFAEELINTLSTELRVNKKLIIEEKEKELKKIIERRKITP